MFRWAQIQTIRRKKKEVEIVTKNQLRHLPVAVEAAAEALLKVVPVLDPAQCQAPVQVQVLDQAPALVDPAAQVLAQERVPRPLSESREVSVAAEAGARAKLIAVAVVRVLIARIKRKKTIRKRWLKSQNQNPGAGPHHLSVRLEKEKKEHLHLVLFEYTLAD